MFYLILV